MTSTLFEPVDAASVPVHTNGATVSIGGGTMTTTSTCRRSCATEPFDRLLLACALLGPSP